MSQSNNFSVGDDCGVSLGAIGFCDGPRSLFSGSTGCFFGTSMYRAKKLASLPSCLASLFVAIALILVHWLHWGQFFVVSFDVAAAQIDVDDESFTFRP